MFRLYETVLYFVQGEDVDAFEFQLEWFDEVQPDNDNIISSFIKSFPEFEGRHKDFIVMSVVRTA